VPRRGALGLLFRQFGGCLLGYGFDFDRRSNQVRNGKGGNPLEKTSSAYHISSPYFGSCVAVFSKLFTREGKMPQYHAIETKGLSNAIRPKIPLDNRLSAMI
jgi:hypothetical protein